MHFIGIDPGASQSSPGAFALIDIFKNIDSLFDWPEDGLKSVAPMLTNILEHIPAANIFAVLENVHSAPGQGVSSTCKFCRNAGHWEGMLAAFQISYILVDPQVWQRKVYLKRPKDKKQAALEKARNLFPNAELKYKKYHGRADALLMAEYARLLHEGI